MRAVERVIRFVMEKYRGFAIEKICDEEGIEIRHDDMGEGYFGLYISLCGKAVINVKSGLSAQENMEVISHELFHHFSLQLSEDPLARSFATEHRCMSPFLNFYIGKEEQEADLFAAFLLCPDVSDCETYQDIMQKYNRSKEVAKLRLVAERLIIHGGIGNDLHEEER